MAAGLILWAFFVALDARRFPAKPGPKARRNAVDSSDGIVATDSDSKAVTDTDHSSDDEAFRLKDVLKVLTNKNFWLLGLLCVLFYSSIVAFKKFAGAILIPRFGIPAATAGWMVSMLPFSTVIFAPLFGLLVDKRGKGTRWMILGSILALIAHLLLAFAPAGVPFYGYLSMVFLGFGYSLVPAALWPSVPKIVPDKVLGTTYSLIYWVQNLGLLSFKWLAGVILGTAAGSAAAAAAGSAAAASSAGSAAAASSASSAAAASSAASSASSAAASSAGSVFSAGALSGPVRVELMFVALCVAAVVIALLFARVSRRRPELRLDAPSGK